MAESSIPVDLLNPGQVFACLGFMEAAETLLGDAEAAFDWSDRSRTQFLLRAAGDTPPVEAVLAFLAEAHVRAEAPATSDASSAWLATWGPLVLQAPGASYPIPEPASAAMVICTLRAGSRVLALEHWGDTTRDNVKFWAGSRGYPGAALARDALELVRSRLTEAIAAPFDVGAPQSSSFRLDWRRDYIPLDAGFSLNNHRGKMEPMGFPLVELLGALGLTNARPLRPFRSNKLQYRYGVIGRDRDTGLWIPPALLRAALGAISTPFPRRQFTMLLDWPGQENQARAITTVMEETIDE